MSLNLIKSFIFKPENLPIIKLIGISKISINTKFFIRNSVLFIYLIPIQDKIAIDTDPKTDRMVAVKPLFIYFFTKKSDRVVINIMPNGGIVAILGSIVTGIFTVPKNKNSIIIANAENI